jgi:hypothetical protein
MNGIAQEAYFASRVEVFTEKCWDANYLDINSSFPFAMTKPCPGPLIKTSRRLPDNDDAIYIAEVTVTVPDCYLPPLPMRMEGRLFFPVGTWKSWLTSVDIALLQKEGGQILRVWEVLHFEPFMDLAEYSSRFYEMRRIATTPFERIAFKLLLNSLYGKFAEGTIKKGLHLNPDMEKIAEEDMSWEMLIPGVWTHEEDRKVPHRHVPISAHITAQARETLYGYMSSCREIHYCDTDGFSTREEMETSDALGDLKLEKKIRHGHFVQCKVYRLDGVELQKDGSWTELGDKGVKAKGFSNMSIEKFNVLLENQAIDYERMRRIKELARRGDFTPREDVIQKKLKNIVLAKRFHYPDGHTRPWQVGELRDYFA